MRNIYLALAILFAFSVLACSKASAVAPTPTTTPVPRASATPTPTSTAPATQTATPVRATTPTPTGAPTTIGAYPEQYRTAFNLSCVGSGMTTATGCECIYRYIESHVSLSDYLAEQRQALSSGQASPTGVKWISDAAVACHIS